MVEVADPMLLPKQSTLAVAAALKLMAGLWESVVFALAVQPCASVTLMV